MTKKRKKKESKPVALATVEVALATVEDLLRESAAAIHTIRDGIRKLSVDSAIEIGRRLSVVRENVDRGRWLGWLEKEFDWSDRSARNFMSVYKLAETTKLENFSNLSIPRSALYLLAAPRTPDKVRDDVLARAKAGEKMSVAKVEKAVAASEQPSTATVVDPEMDAIISKRAEHTIDNEPQTVAAAGTHSASRKLSQKQSSRKRHANPRRKYIEFLKLLSPEEVREELESLSTAIIHLECGCTISVESTEEVSGDSGRL